MRIEPMLIAVALILQGCGDRSSNATMGGNVSAEATVENTADATPSPPVAFGQTAQAPDFRLTVQSVEQRTSIGSSTRAAAGETLVVVRYAFENTSNEPISRGQRPEMKLVDPQGRSYSDDGAAGLGLTGLGDATNDTNPGTTAKVAVVWRVEKASFEKGGWTLV